MKLLLFATSGQVSKTLEMLNPVTFVFHAIMERIFLHRKPMSSAFTVRMAPGKTTFIDALEILKTLLSGQKVGAELSDCISYGQEKAELQFEFSILKLNEGNAAYRRRFIYAAALSKDTIDETIKCVTFSSDPEKTSRLKTIFECTHQEEDDVFTPQVKLESLFGS